MVIQKRLEKRKSQKFLRLMPKKKMKKASAGLKV